MSVGATTVLNSERPTPALMFALMHKYNPSIFFGVPTLFSAMLNDETQKSERGGTKVAHLYLSRRGAPAGIGRQ